LETDHNSWNDMMESSVMTFLQVFTGGWCLLNVFFAARRLLVFFRNPNSPRLPRVCLSLELIANIQRFLFLGVDPFGSRQIYIRVIAIIFTSMSFPVAFISNMLLAYTWRNALQLVQKATPTFNQLRYRILFVTLSLILLCDTPFAALRGTYSRSESPNAFIIIETTIMFILNTLICFFFLRDRFRIVKLQNQMSQFLKTDDKVQALNTASVDLFVTAIGMLVASVIILFPSYLVAYWVPWGYFTTNFLSAISSLLVSFFQIRLFSSSALRPQNQSQGTGMSTEDHTDEPGMKESTQTL